MLKLTSVQEVDGQVCCEVKNMRMGEAGQGFTLYRGSLCFALTNVIQKTFGVAKDSLNAAREALQFIKSNHPNIKDCEDLEESLRILCETKNLQSISAEQIIVSRGLPKDITTLMYPQVEWRENDCPKTKMVKVLVKPKIKKNSIGLTLPCGKEIDVHKTAVLYYA